MCGNKCPRVVTQNQTHKRMIRAKHAAHKHHVANQVNIQKINPLSGHAHSGWAIWNRQVLRGAGNDVSNWAERAHTGRDYSKKLLHRAHWCLLHYKSGVLEVSFLSCFTGRRVILNALCFSYWLDKYISQYGNRGNPLQKPWLVRKTSWIISVQVNCSHLKSEAPNPQYHNLQKNYQWFFTHVIKIPWSYIFWQFVKTFSLAVSQTNSLRNET